MGPCMQTAAYAAYAGILSKKYRLKNYKDGLSPYKKGLGQAGVEKVCVLHTKHVVCNLV
ncbi:MAG: hypothetical protein ACYC2U_03290 [Candidatus Amoebophilus sp.]